MDHSREALDTTSKSEFEDTKLRRLEESTPHQKLRGSLASPSQQLSQSAEILKDLAGYQPAHGAQAAASPAAVTVVPPAAAVAMAPPPPPPPDEVEEVVEVVDPATRKTYYHNRRTGKTGWAREDVAAAAAAEAAAAKMLVGAALPVASLVVGDGGGGSLAAALGSAVAVTGASSSSSSSSSSSAPRPSFPVTAGSYATMGSPLDGTALTVGVWVFLNERARESKTMLTLLGNKAPGCQTDAANHGYALCVIIRQKRLTTPTPCALK